VEPNGFPDYRYNDKEVIRRFADESAKTYECCSTWPHLSTSPDTLADTQRELRSRRTMRAAGVALFRPAAGEPERARPRLGVGLIRRSNYRQKIGVQILLQHKWSASSGE